MAEINWTLPDPDATYDQTLVYRAASKYGTYSLIATLSNIRITKYVDLTGSLTSWAKVRWYDSTNLVYSNYSAPIPYTGTVSDTNYTTPRQVASYLNRYRTIVAEAVGTGAGVVKVFGPVADPKMIADTEVIYVAATATKRNVDYTIDYDTGTVTFAAAPTGAITADYWADSTVVNSRTVAAIRRAEDEINRKTGRTFYQPQTVIEFVDSYDPINTDIRAYSLGTLDDTIQPYKPNTNTPLISRVLQLANYPVTSVSQLIINAQPTSVTSEAVGTGAGVVLDFSLDYNPVVYGSEIVYVAGSQVTNYTMNYTTGVITFNAAPTGAITADYQHCTQGVVIDSKDCLLREDSGTIILKDTVAQLKRNPLIATVVYAYGFYEPPPVVQDLATRIAARVVFQSTLIGSPNPMDFTSSNLAVMQRDIDQLYDTIGRKMIMTRL
jgi:hypothetical protein